MDERYDAIVIGAGHNGLVCASLLAKAGKKVLVLEAGSQVGGAAVTREFADGYSVSACAHLLYQLQPQVQRELDLKLTLASKKMTTVALATDGNHVRYRGKEVSGTSDADAASFRDFHRRMSRFADLLQTYLNKVPPRLAADAGMDDVLTLARFGFDVRRLGKTELREFLRLIGINIFDELAERFENPLLKGALSLDAVLGTHLGPRSPNTILTYLYRLAGSHGSLSAPAGGMSSLTEALAHSARDNGATIRTGMHVKRIVVDNGRVAGVETDSGETFDSWLVVSNADPKSTIMKLVSARNVEPEFTRRIHNIRMRGNAAKLHLALSALPSIAGLEDQEYGERIVIAPDEVYVERAFNAAKYGEISAKPVFEITFPTHRDPGLAPEGKHVMSAIVQYAPYQLKQGWSDATREAFCEQAIDTLSDYMPDLRQNIVASETLTPADIEEQFLIGGGHWHHGELALDQFLFTRPVGGAAQYAMPLDGLYLCGAGAHPGGGVSGAAGRNAARMILKRGKAA
ncbi:MAG: NAD(P)/FAD-dependent oxidoreductase [Woeseiaceae bacterium]|nr:NAD(P)/FAD-dependent oxidoreductase [Woeseiaceae bacterium]